MDWHRRKQDGSFADQQQFLADIRSKESKRAHERLLERDRDASQYRQEENARTARLQAELREQQAVADHERAMLRDKYLSELRLAEADAALLRSKELVVAQAQSQLHLAEEMRELSENPFAYSLDRVRERVLIATDEGRKPALLFAPFNHEDVTGRRDSSGPELSTALRQWWRNADWKNDMAALGGLINRPLRHTDIDLQTIRLALHDLPVVVIHGQVQSGARAWIGISAWNLGDTSGTRVLDVDLPPIPLPDETGDVKDRTVRRLAFEDHVGQLCALIAGAYGEWFHIMSRGRVPRLHRLLPEDWSAEARVLAANSAELVTIPEEQGLIESGQARLIRAVVLAEGGYFARATEIFVDGGPELEQQLLVRDSDKHGSELFDRLLATLEQSPQSELAQHLHQKVAELKRAALHRRMGWH